MSKIKIIRTGWGDYKDKWADVPKIPLYDNEIVYVWGNENKKQLEKRGYKCITMQDNKFTGSNVYGKKLQVIDAALKEFGEVLMLDWDCFLGKPLDNDFYNMISQKPIQVPLYTHYKEPMFALLEAIPDNHPILQTEESYVDLIDNLSTIESQIQYYHWKWEDGLVIPNFGCVYSRDKNFGADLIKIAKENNIKGLVEEFAMWKYANCSMEEYINKYHPNYVLGVSDKIILEQKYNIQIIQSKLNEYLKTKLKLNLYYEHL